jgi:predicted amidophosphoribosyltransferase
MSGILSEKQEAMRKRQPVEVVVRNQKERERPKPVDNKRACPKCGNQSAFRRRYCTSCINQAEELVSCSEMRRLDGDESVVYFIQASNGPIKIGYTRQLYLVRRVADLQVGNPFLLRLIAVIDGATLTDETTIHNQFRKDRLCGEWFSPSTELLEYIRKQSTRRFHTSSV